MLKNKGFVVISSALIIILGFAIYGNSLNGQFVWDDEYLIKNNVYIKNLSCLGKIFSQNIDAGAGKKSNFYRPLQTLSYLFDYQFWKLDVRGYHLTNIILHILVTFAIFWLSSLLFKDRLLALLTSLLFIAHPVHTEAVAYISGRADPLGLLFILLSFIFYLKFLNAGVFKLYSLALLSFTFALLSREIAVIFPALLLIYHYSFKLKARFRRLAPFFALSAICIFLRLTLLNFPLAENAPERATVLWQRMPGFFAALANYIRILFLPFELHMEYGWKIFSFSHPLAIIGIFIFGFLVVYAFGQNRKNSLIAFSIFWFLITLLPVSNLYPINAYMAEHWLYLPSIGFCLILAKGLSSLDNKKELKKLSIILALFLVSFYSYRTIKQNNYWQDPITFYERTLKYNPDSFRMYNNLGLRHKNMGRHQEAIALYQKSIELKPDFAQAYNNLGVSYNALGRRQEAQAMLEKSLELEPASFEACNNLGLVYAAMGKNKEAIALYQQAIALNANYALAYNNLGLAYLAAGSLAQAISLYQQAIALDPDIAEIYNNLGAAYSTMGNHQQAISLYQQAIALDPNLTEASNNLAKTYDVLGRTGPNPH